jgi:hypothetical protein
MQEGFIVNPTVFRGTFNVSGWHSGSPQKSFWSGIKVQESKLRPITTYRCDQCGFLEGYAY